MSGIYLFVGPTIQPKEVADFLEATCLPPVSQGDILRVLRHEPDVIGIIDGYFERIPSVWHKEILQALAQGVRVVGGSSMGALRAAELYPFGMVGVGQVFEWYRDGVITADDEVAIRHASAEFDYQAFSEAMVNIRASLGQAAKQNIISPATYDSLIALGRSLPYYQRSYAALWEKAATAGLPEDELADLQQFISRSKIDQKKQDALAVVEYIRDHVNETGPARVAFQLQNTTRLEELADRDLCLDTVEGLRLTPEVIVERARTRIQDFAELQIQATTQGLMLRLARQLDMQVGESDLEHGLIEFKQVHGLDSDEAVARWLKQNQLTSKEFLQLVTESLLVAKVQRTFQPDNRDILRQLRLAGRYSDLAAAPFQTAEV